jgi:hypothetical protein
MNVFVLFGREPEGRRASQARLVEGVATLVSPKIAVLGRRARLHQLTVCCSRGRR